MNKKNVDKLDFTNINNKQRASSANKKFELGSSTWIKLNNEQKYSIHYNDLVEETVLGCGEYGIVKRMRHEPTKLVFAVKFINEYLIESSENKNSSLMDLEVSIKLGNGCPNLIRFYGALYTQSIYMILTEMMDTSLDRFYLKANSMRLRLPEALYAKISLSVLNALDYMRKLHVMHRDIKPSNILIDSNGEIKVCDFGISGFTTDSICKTFKGCQRYMAPEKIQPSEKGYSIKSDIWSLGISLIEMANGNHPFSSSKGIYELTTTILDCDPPKLDSDKYSHEFCSFVNQCLIKCVETRPSISELLNHSFIKNETLIKQNDVVLTIVRVIIDELKKNPI